VNVIEKSNDERGKGKKATKAVFLFLHFFFVLWSLFWRCQPSKAEEEEDGSCAARFIR
jgi:hypothetical protein